MKRAYVKPVMESEAFVANEYVAACWEVTCENCGPETYKGVSENGPDGLLLYEGVTNGVFTGEMNGVTPGCKQGGLWDYVVSLNLGWLTGLAYLYYKYIEEVNPSAKYHPVSARKGYEVNGTFHPNISI